MPTAAPEGVFEGLAEAIGDSDNSLGGRLFTFLAGEVTAQSTVFPVDSTLGWLTPTSNSPKPLFLRIGVERLEIVAMTATSITVKERGPEARAYSRGKILFDDSQIVSQVESARSQLTLLWATGSYLREILRNCGLDLPDVTVEDDALRNWGMKACFPEAGPTKFIAECLDALLNGQLRFGDVVASDQFQLTDSTTFPAGMNRRLLRILEPSQNSGLYRIRVLDTVTDPTLVTLEPAAGVYYDGGADLTLESNVAVELVPWDLWEDVSKPATFNIDVLRFGAFAGVLGSAYLQGGEPQTSTSTTTVDVTDTPNNVLGVFLAGDLERAGTNYYEPGGSFLGNTITLGTALPGAATPVIVDYGSIAYTAQILNGASVDGVDYFPFYLGTPVSYVEPFIDVIRAAGFLPLINEVVI